MHTSYGGGVGGGGGGHGTSASESLVGGGGNRAYGGSGGGGGGGGGGSGRKEGDVNVHAGGAPHGWALQLPAAMAKPVKDALKAAGWLDAGR